MFPSLNIPMQAIVNLANSCTQATYLTKTRLLLPSFPLSHISFSPSYTSHFLAKLPNLGVNMLQRSLAGFSGPAFLRRCSVLDSDVDEDDKDGQLRPLFVWTVNDVRWMEWCLRNNASAGAPGRRCIDGVITDDPRLFLEVCRRWEGGGEDGDPGAHRSQDGWGQWARTGLDLMVVRIFRFGLFWARRFSGRFDYLDEVQGWK